MTFPTLKSAANRAKAWIAEGDSVDLGLMQINSGNLKSLGFTVENALDACGSLKAGARMLSAAYTRNSSAADRQAALLVALSRYNTGDALAGLANGYAGEILAAQTNVDSAKSPAATIEFSPQPSWNIWPSLAAGREGADWVFGTQNTTVGIRAGAQTSDARNEGRATASPSEKGEPYELSAYQESDPTKP